VVFGNKKIFIVIDLASHRCSPKQVFGSNRLRLIRGLRTSRVIALW
jgi:hypothetical protein